MFVFPFFLCTTTSVQGSISKDTVRPSPDTFNIVVVWSFSVFIPSTVYSKKNVKYCTGPCLSDEMRARSFHFIYRSKNLYDPCRGVGLFFADRSVCESIPFSIDSEVAQTLLCPITLTDCMNSINSNKKSVSTTWCRYPWRSHDIGILKGDSW